MQLFRHDVHDFAIAENFGAADVEDAGGGFGLFEDAGEVVEDVADGDGLAGSGHPLRRDHDGKALHEVTKNFERGRAGADDHRGAERGDWNSAVDQGFFDGAARGEMFAEVRPGFAETTEIDDARDAGLFGGVGESCGELEIAVGVFGAGGYHGVNEVIRGGTVFQCGEESFFVREVELDDFEIRDVGPRAILKFAL